MIQSMTAFAKEEIKEEWGQASWEIKSINHRYLDVYFKLPEAFRSFESEWQTLARKTLHRGKIECLLGYSAVVSSNKTLAIDEQLAQQVFDLNQYLATKFRMSAQTDPFDILRWPNVVITAQSQEHLQKPLTSLLQKTLEQLIEHRSREGQGCKAVIQNRLSTIESKVQEARNLLPELEQNIRNKLQQKIKDISQQVEKDRFEQEIIFFLNKMDIAEELDRLHIHVQEVQRVLKQGGHVGRRLDFLMQELNREANTTSAKSLDTRLTQCAIEIKVCVEQMREQIQNLE